MAEQTDKLTPERSAEVEDFVLAALTNEPSDPLAVDSYKVRVVFKRPAMIDKFRQRTWAAKKLKEIESSDDDPQTQFFFRYWGTLNSYVDKILIEDGDGLVKVGGKKYREYFFDPKTDLDYKSLFEKYVMEEVYNKGFSEEAFVSAVIMVHANWVSEHAKIAEGDVKNS